MDEIKNRRMVYYFFHPTPPNLSLKEQDLKEVVTEYLESFNKISQE